MSETLFHFTVVEFGLSATSMRSHITVPPTVIRKQVIHQLIKERKVCDVVKSECDGRLIKAAHVHPWKERDNLVYGTKPRHNTYVQRNIIHFHAACTVIGKKGRFSSNSTARKTYLHEIVFFFGDLRNKGNASIILKVYFGYIHFESRVACS